MKKLLYILLLASLSACTFLEEYSQDQDYVRTWKDLDELLIGDCYMPANESQEWPSSENPGHFLHLLADEMEEQNSSPTQNVVFDYKDQSFGYFTWQQRVGEAPTYTEFYDENVLWTKIYYLINVANNILNSVEDVPQITDDEIQGAKRVRGEAHFLRAYYYFWLVNIYGKAYDPATAATDPGVPLKTSEEVQDIKFQRNTVKEVYNQVLADLAKAEKYLGQVTAKKKSIYRADSTAALMLHAKVSLYMQDWNSALSYAQRVINAHPTLMNLNTTSSKFATVDNVENLFSMGGNDTPCMMDYAYQCYRISNDQYTSYGSNDMRRSRWFWHKGDFTGIAKLPEGNRYTDLDRSSAYYFYYAYFNGCCYSKQPISGLFWLRSSDAYLTAAEAAAYLGQEDLSQKLLNEFRTNRYSKNATVQLTGKELISQIRTERRLEFVMEGQRWFDLRRYRVCQVAPEKTSITHDYTYYSGRGEIKMTERHRFVLTEDDDAWTLPIPQEVIEFNTGMQQNPSHWREYQNIGL